MTRTAATTAVCVLLAIAVSAANEVHEPGALQLDIESQPLADALNDLAKRSGLQIVFYSEIAEGLRAAPLNGYFTVRAALEQLLADTSLEFEFIDEHTIAVRVADLQRREAEASNGTAPQPRHRAPRRDHGIQEPQNLELETITVTARRREENLQKTPVAVSALSGDALELRSASAADALSQFVPNLQFDGAAPLSGAAYNATIFIRGIGQNDFAIFSEPGVAVYLDGVYLGRSIGGVMELLDLERVEVLRGPQGTLFGRNTIGGAINMVSHRPDDAFGGRASVTVGDLERREVHATLNVPLNDEIFSRLTVTSVHRDGTATRLFDGAHLGDKDTITGRGQILWRPAEGTSALLALDATRVRQNSAPLTLVDVAATGAPFLNLYNSLVAPTLQVNAPDGASTVNSSWITNDVDRTYAGGASASSLDSLGAALTLERRMGAVDVKSITAWRKLDAFFARDGDNTPFTYRETINDDIQEQFSEELHLSGVSLGRRLEWLTGLYFFREDASEDGAAILGRGIFAALESLMLAPGQTWCGLDGPNPRPASQCPPSHRYGGAAYHDNNVLADLDVAFYTRTENRSIAMFGHGTYHLTDRLGATAGLRWTYDRKKADLVHRRLGSGEYIVGGPGMQREFAESWSELTPKLSVEWQGTPDALLYASYSKGFKSGGFNGRPLVDDREVRTAHAPEVVDSYELGAKTSWFDGRVTANAALFYNEYRDMQLSINATPQNFVRNAAEARVRGAEVELVARLARGFDLNAAAGYLDAQYTHFDAQLETLRPALTREKGFIKAPEWTVNAGLQYRIVRRYGTFTLRGDYSYRSRVYHDVFNDPRLTQDAFGLVNAFAGYTTADQRWEAAVFGTNLTDERYRISGNSSAAFGLAESTFSSPREVGMTLRLRF